MGDVIEGVQSVLPPTLIKLLRQVEHEGDNVLLETVLITLQANTAVSFHKTNELSQVSSELMTVPSLGSRWGG